MGENMNKNKNKKYGNYDYEKLYYQFLKGNNINKNLDNYDYENLYKLYKFITKKMSKEDLIEDLRVNNNFSIMVKTIKAGDFLESEIYPVWKNRSDLIRAKKECTQRIEQKNLNDKNVKKKITRLAHTNFKIGVDLKLGLSFKRNTTIEEARKKLKNFFLRLNRMRKNELKKLGSEDKYEFKYIYVIEGSDKRERVHVHLIINSLGIPEERDKIEKIWGLGFCNTERLQDFDFGIEDLTNYMAKGLKDSKRRWAHSKNLKKPIETTNKSLLTKKKLRNLIEYENYFPSLFEKIYPGYKFSSNEIYVNDVFEGVYVRVKMKRSYL